MNLKLKEVYKLFKNKFSGSDAQIKGVAIDNRGIKKGELFIAIKGENNDGHLFVADALKKGACAVLAEKEIKGVDSKKVILVKDTKAAMLKLAAYYYSKFKNLKTVAITGSNGKTTTKEIAYAFLSAKYTVLKNEKSFNNYAGLPLTIFRLRDKHEIIILEMGMNRKGELKQLASLVDIDIAVITNIGRAHMGFFDSMKDIADAKAEIVYGLKKNGIAVLNIDDKFYDYLARKTSGRELKSFGILNGATLRIEDVDMSRSVTKFALVQGKTRYAMKTGLKGIHNLYNIAAAATVAVSFGVALETVGKIAARFKMKDLMRFEEKRIKDKGLLVINDCYNANPDSFSASIETLKALKYKSLVAVTGDMLEQGGNTKMVHEELGDKLAALDLKGLFIFGKYSEFVEKAFLAGREDTHKMIVKRFDDRKKLAAALKKVLKKGDTVFLKGSRGNKLEEVTELIIK
ncbi:MAG: UDP-N-acetylmuramoyl-tripeptide--D-alanyl-D-alanine ligase [bacterium]